jgi:hypothetical protein
MSTASRRAWLGRFMVIGGVSWIIFGLSHLLFPTLLAWDTALSNVPPGSLFGLPLSNQGFIYLFNADLLLYDIFFGVLSLLLAAHARRGRRIAAQFGIGMGVYFVIRAGLQLYYFGTSLLDIVQVVAALAYAAIYLFPLTGLSDFAEE